MLEGGNHLEANIAVTRRRYQSLSED